MPYRSWTLWTSTSSTSTASHWVAWSLSRSRCATPSASDPSSWAEHIRAAGGRALPDPEVIAFFQRRARMPPQEAAWASVPFNYGPRSQAEQADRIAEDIERRLRNPFNERAYRAQLLAASLHNCYGRLERISAPTLVVHGARDRIIPVDNAHMTAERVPGAQLKILEDAGHLYPTEEPAVDKAIGSFFAAHG